MKILVVRLSSLGDIVHLFPAVSDLRGRYPDAEIHWLVESAFADLAGLHSAVDKVIQVPLRAHKKHWWRLPTLLRNVRSQLLAERYDVVLDAQGLLKSAILGRLAGAEVCGFAAGCAREPVAAWFYGKTADVGHGLHVIDKNRRLVEQIFGTDISGPANYGLDRFREDAAKINLPGPLTEAFDFPGVVLLHGTTWDSKYWPEDYWKQLIVLLSRQNWRCLLPWGNNEEFHRAKRLSAAAPEHAIVLPKLSLPELLAVLLRFRLFVSVESGVGHLASVLDIPGIMMHGPTDPAYSGILGKACVHMTTGLDCSPCFKRTCPRLQGRQDVPPCQQELKPLQVYRHCLSLISSNPERVGG